MQEYIPASGDAILTSGYDILLFVIMLIAGLCTILANRRYKRSGVPQVKVFYRWIYLIILLNIACYTAIIYVVFSCKSIAGYHETTIWLWNHTNKAYEPLYKGEWFAFFFLYIAPVCIAFLYMCYLQPGAKGLFLKVFAVMYPWVVVWTYVGHLIILLTFFDDAQSTIQRPEIDTGDRVFLQYMHTPYVLQGKHLNANGNVA